ncbi:hypothetical protein V6N13_107159 [Hibiscus sabdariffa]|uniref:Uncharacterized protein n=1 Tax=Hibiscus sabdariffa TaxID=183260 RepID=A0ABR2F311_9ROSI
MNEQSSTAMASTEDLESTPIEELKIKEKDNESLKMEFRKDEALELEMSEKMRFQQDSEVLGAYHKLHVSLLLAILEQGHNSNTSNVRGNHQ